MKHIVKPALSLFVVAAIAAVLLGIVYDMTYEPIQARRQLTQERMLREIMEKASDFREMPVETPWSIVRVFEGLSEGETVGYVIELAPMGYGGPINMMVGISTVDDLVTGMRVLRHNETPGFGAVITRENFFRRFDGLNLVPLTVVRSSPGANEFQAITSSTITTRAVVDAVNEAIEWYNEIRAPAILSSRLMDTIPPSGIEQARMQINEAWQTIQEAMQSVQREAQQ